VGQPISESYSRVLYKVTMNPQHIAAPSLGRRIKIHPDPHDGNAQRDAYQRRSVDLEPGPEGNPGLRCTPGSHLIPA